MAVPAAPGAPKPPDEFDLARQRASQQNQAAVQGQRDALKRRAAAMGNVNSGAFIKQDQLAQQEGAKQLQDANEGINTAKFAEDRRIQEIKDAQAYQTSERVGSQTFASGERLGSQTYATGERVAGQKFAGNQAALDRRLATAGLTGTLDGKRTLAGTSLDSANKQTKFENDANMKTNVISTITSLKNSGIPPEAIGNILHSLGLDKLGVNLDDIIGVTTGPKPLTKAEIMAQEAAVQKKATEMKSTPIRRHR